MAYLNIQIPQLLGGIIDVVSKHSHDMIIIGSGDVASGNFFADMKQPALNLLSMYAAQVSLFFINKTTCFYLLATTFSHFSLLCIYISYLELVKN